MIHSRVLLSSGGMDSFLLAHLLGKDALHLFVDIGQQYSLKERRAMRDTAESVGAHYRTELGAQIAPHIHTQSGIIPFRNAELILCAAQYADDIYLGVLYGEINSDKSEEFLAAMELVLNISHRRQYWTEGRELRLHTPLRDKTKTEAVRDYLGAGGDPVPLLRTVSCYSATLSHCGRCPSCFKRWIALVNNGLPLTGFEYDPRNWLPLEHWRHAATGFAVQRREELEDAFRRVGTPL